MRVWKNLSFILGFTGLNFAQAGTIDFKFSACEIREFIGQFCEQNPMVGELFGFHQIHEEVPYGGIIVYPDPWLEVTAPHNNRKPFVFLGDWKVQFGFDGTDYYIVSIQFTRKVYSGTCGSQTADCRRLVILLDENSIRDFAVDQVEWYVIDFTLKKINDITWISNRLYFIDGSNEFRDKIELSKSHDGRSTMIYEFEPRGSFEPFR